MWCSALNKIHLTSLAAATHVSLLEFTLCRLRAIHDITAT